MDVGVKIHFIMFQKIVPPGTAAFCITCYIARGRVKSAKTKQIFTPEL